MTYRPDREKAGFLQVTFRHGDFLLIRRNEWDDLTEALKKGEKDWYEATDLFGELQLIRLSSVVLVALVTPSGVAQSDEEEVQRAAHKRDKGDE